MSARPTYKKRPEVTAAIHCLVARSEATASAMYRPMKENMALPTFSSRALRTDTPLCSKMAKSPGARGNRPRIQDKSDKSRSSVAADERFTQFVR